MVLQNKQNTEAPGHDTCSTTKIPSLTKKATSAEEMTDFY